MYVSTEPQILLYFGVQDLSWKSIKSAYFQDKLVPTKEGSWTPKYLIIYASVLNNPPFN